MLMRVIRDKDFDTTTTALKRAPTFIAGQVRVLRGALTAALLGHSTHNITLARDNRHYCRRTLRVLARCRQLISSIARVGAHPRKVVHVNYDFNFKHDRVTPTVARLVHGCPRLRIRFRLFSQRVSLIRSGVSLSVHVGSRVPSCCVTRLLAGGGEVLYTTPRCLRGCPRPRSLRRLDHRSYLIAGRHSVARKV